MVIAPSLGNFMLIREVPNFSWKLVGVAEVEKSCCSSVQDLQLASVYANYGFALFPIVCTFNLNLIFLVSLLGNP